MAKLEKESAERLLKASVKLSAICLLLIVALVAWTAWRSIKDKPWQETGNAIKTPNIEPTATTQPSPLTAEQKLQLQNSVAGTQAALIAEIRANDSSERAILDRLITLVGVYSAILSLTAFLSLHYARESAAADLKNFQEKATLDIDTFKSATLADMTTQRTTIEAAVKTFQETTRLQLDSLTKTTSLQIEDFTKKIWNELPEMRNLKGSLLDLLLDLERVVPAETNWNAERPYESLDESQKQKILISESTVNALQIFISGDSAVHKETLARFYQALARFYLGKFRIENQASDAERADIYARKSHEIDVDNADAYRLRGAIYLARYRILNESLKSAPSLLEAEELSKLLASAESFLRATIKKYENDAGAAYNLAIAASNRDALDEAISISTMAIANRDKFSHLHVRKYLPDLYLNLACFFAMKLKKRAGANEQDDWQARAVEVLVEGHEYFSSANLQAGLERMRNGISRELKQGGDLETLDAEHRQKIEALFFWKTS